MSTEVPIIWVWIDLKKQLITLTPKEAMMLCHELHTLFWKQMDRLQSHPPEPLPTPVVIERGPWWPPHWKLDPKDKSILNIPLITS